MKKRFLALLLTFVMVLAIVPWSAFATDGVEEAPVPPVSAELAETVTAEAADAGTTTVLAFTSDTHNASGNSAANRLGTWLDNMYTKYGKIDVMAFGGDMASASVYGDSFWTLAQADMDACNTRITNGKLGNVLYTTGNHEYMNGSYSNGTNTTTQQFREDQEIANTDTYRMYALGSAGGSNNWNKYMDDQITKLSAYLSSVGSDKPIFIITHYPLHYEPKRTISNADQVIDALNNAAATGKKIVFLWGHNHTDAPNSETHYDEIFAPGESLEYASGKSKTLQFVYGAAGCMSDSDYGSGSGSVKGKGLIVTINSKGQLSCAYYDANGNDVTEEGRGYTEADPIAIEGFTFDETAPTVMAGKSVQLHYTTVPADATVRSVTWTSGDTGIATVDTAGKVKGVSAGTVTITAQISDGISKNTVTNTIDVTVTPRDTTGTIYVLASELQDDTNYLIVSAKTEGNAYAVANDGASSGGTSMGRAAVEILSGDVTGDGVADLYIDTDVEKIIWTTVASGSGFDLMNDEAYLAGKGGTPGIFTAKPYTDRYWTYSSEHLLYGGPNSSYTYELYYSNNAFTARSFNSGNPNYNIYIFEQAAPVGTDPVSGVSLNKTTLTLGQGATEKLIATVAPATAQNKNVSWLSSAPGVATVSASGVVTGVTPGTAVITVTTEDGGYTATCNVTVTEEVLYSYVLTETLAAGNDYMIVYIASGNTTNGSGYAITNVAGSSARQLLGEAVNIVDGKVTINDAVKAKAVFTCYLETASNANSTRLKIGEQDLYTNNADGLRMFTMTSEEADKHWHYKGDGKNLLWFFKDTSSSDGYTDTSGTYKYYLECNSSGVFTDNHVSTTSLSNSNLPSIYLFTRKVPVTGVTVSPTTASIAVGEETQLTATVAPADASIQTVTWSSSDTSVATVDANGKVTGKAAGTATITVTTDDGAFTAACVVTVSVVHVESIAIDPASTTVEIGRTKDLTVTITPENATNKNVTWTSSNEAVATVENGEVTGVSEGTVTITATTEDGNKTATCSVTVIQPTVRAGYVIVVDGYALSTTAEPDTIYHPEDSGNNRYYGLHGVKYEGDLVQNPTEDILWQINDVAGGYYIQSMDGRYLNAVYSTNTSGSSTTYTGHLNLDDTPDIWVLDGDLEDWILNGSYLKSTNATTSSKEICLAFETVGPNNSSITLFTIRSRSNADSSTVTSPDITAEIRYNEASQFENNEEYLIGVNSDNSGNKVWAVKNITGTDSGNTGSVQLDVTPASGSDPAYIISDDIGLPWKYTSSNQYLANQSRYLNQRNNVPRVSANGTAATYSGSLRLGSYYLTLSSASNGTFGVSTSSSSAAAVRIFRKTTTITYDIKFIGANGQILEVDELAKGDMPVYHGATPTKADDDEYTYTFIGWSPEIEAVKGLAIYTAQFEAVPKEQGPAVTFVDYDGTVIATIHVTEGTAWDEFDKPADPVRTGYTFTGWAGAPATVTEDVTVTATYEAIFYTITFKDADGTVLQTGQVAYDQTPAYTGTEPSKAANANYRYEFAGWTPAIAPVTGDATYTATYTEIARTYGQPEWSWTGSDAAGYTAATASFTTNDGAAEFTRDVTDNQIDVTTTAATCEAAGQKVYNASVTFNGTEYTDSKTVAIEALGHDWTFDGFTWAGSSANGYTGATADYTCSRDASHKISVDAEFTSATTAESCTEPGTVTYTASVSAEVSKDGKPHTDSKTVTGTAPGHSLTEHPATEATCTTAGNTAYWSCERCGKFFSDAEGNTEIEENSWVIAALGHNMTEHAAVAATCETAGSSAYWSCSRCGKFFSDAEGATEIEENAWVIPAKGHNWALIAWTWEGYTAATATFVCQNDDSHTETVAADIVRTQAEGVVTYTASVLFNNKSYTNVKTVEYPVNITSVRLDLQSKIGIRIYFKTPETAKTAKIFFEDVKTHEFASEASVTMELTRDGNKYYNPKTGEFLMVYPKITSRQMTMHIRFVVYDENDQPMASYFVTEDTYHDEAFDYCAADWAHRILATSANEKAITMAKALLNYGGEAQKYLNNYNPDNPANPEGYMAEEMAALVPDAALDGTIPANTEALGLTSIKLDLAEETSIRLYFNKAVTVKVDGKDVKVATNGTQWLVVIDGIYSRYLNHMYEIEVTGEAGTATIIYSALSWANDKIANGPEDAVPTAKALYLYHYAAVDYLGSN